MFLLQNQYSRTVKKFVFRAAGAKRAKVSGVTGMNCLFFCSSFFFN